jgi:hypothetical protein
MIDRMVRVTPSHTHQYIFTTEITEDKVKINLSLESQKMQLKMITAEFLGSKSGLNSIYIKILNE